MDARIFGIDGTLLQSFATDADLFVLAVKEVLGVAEVDTRWASYRHITDQGIAREIIHAHAIAPTVERFAAIEYAFVTRLEAHIKANGGFKEVPGAKAYVAQLLASDRHYVAMATGAWRSVAILKLESAEFPVQGIRLATSSEHEDLVSIMQSAIESIPCPAETVTYYGDGVWDRTAAQALGWRFVPVGASLQGLASFFEAS